ncbi:hypothetical protein [Vibrio sp. CJQ_6]|uniref:hypothetical protein n=1 Tax=Vibrio sp. CJQ_6 TaxID=3367165 RepID=UPI00370B7274
MVSDGTLCEEGENPPECEGDDCVTPAPVPDPEPDPDPYLPLNNYFKATCTNGVCTGTVETNSAIRAWSETSYNWAHFMNNRGYKALTDALTLTIPQKIVKAKKDTLDKLDDIEASIESQSEIDLDSLLLNSQQYRDDRQMMNTILRLSGQAESAANISSFKLDMLSLDMMKLNDKIDGNQGSNTANISALADSMTSNFKTTNGNISALSDGLEALSSQISGAGGTGGDVDLSGVESKLQGIQETLNGKGMVGRPFEGQVDFEANGLYGSDAIENLEGEIEQLETQYHEQMEQFKSLFTFDESELADGTYIEHKWTFRFANGHVNSFSSGVFPALLENSSLIAAVLLFLAVLLGIKALTD